MSDASMPNQATEPNQEVASSQQAQLYAPPNPGGSALLDANIALLSQHTPRGRSDRQSDRHQFLIRDWNR